MTNVTFFFETFPYTKLKGKNMGEHGILYPHCLKKLGDTSIVSPYLISPMKVHVAHNTIKR